jgi:hypothetical protein
LDKAFANKTLSHGNDLNNNRRAVVSVDPSRDVITETRLKVRTVVRGPPFRENLRAEAEGCPLLEAVIRKQLVKTQQAGKDLACAVICKAWRLAMAL